LGEKKFAKGPELLNVVFNVIGKHRPVFFRWFLTRFIKPSGFLHIQDLKIEAKFSGKTIYVQDIANHTCTPRNKVHLTGIQVTIATR